MLEATSRPPADEEIEESSRNSTGRNRWAECWCGVGMVLALYAGLLNVADSDAAAVAALGDGSDDGFTQQEFTCTGGTVGVQLNGTPGIDPRPYLYTLGSLGQCDGELYPECAAIGGVGLDIDGRRPLEIVGVADTVLAGPYSAAELNAFETTTFINIYCNKFRLVNPTFIDLDAGVPPHDVTCTGGSVRVDTIDNPEEGPAYVYQRGSFGQCDGVGPTLCGGLPTVYLTVNGSRAPGLTGLADSVLGGSLSADELNASHTTTYFWSQCGTTFRLVNPTYVDTGLCEASPQTCDFDYSLPFA